jgi:hypothetical protein
MEFSDFDEVDYGASDTPRVTKHNWDMEECCICNSSTSYWHVQNDVPLCPHCAGKMHKSAVPTKAQWLTSLGFNLPRKWEPKKYNRKPSSIF